MSEHTTISLAGDEIEIHDLPIRKVQDWRKRARVILESQEVIAEGIQQLDDADASEFAPIYQKYVDLLDDHSETILDLVLDYLPDQGKREHYAEQVTEPEVLTAFFPLSRKSFSNVFFWEMVSAVLIHGSSDSPTETNSPGQSGESGPAS